jgi:transposase-like protein
MSSQKRRHWTAEEKLQIQAFRKSLSKKEGAEARKTDSTVSEVCRRYGTGTGQFYAWEKLARQGALEALRDGKRGRKKTRQEAVLQSEMERLRAVVAELSMENLKLKKGWLA